MYPRASEHATMTGRERVARMFDREDHDRVPRHDTYWRETIARWQGEGLGGDANTALEVLGTDFHGVAGSWPCPFPGLNETVAEDTETRTSIDSWGATVRHWKHRSGTPEHIAFGCDSPEAWRTRYKPAYDELALTPDPQAVRQTLKDGRDQGRWCYLTALESFESTRRLMGDVIALSAMAEDPEWFLDVTTTYTDAVIRGLDAILDTGVEPDGLWIYGDMAYNHATMCSPAMYRQLVWPDHKRLADWGHAHDLKVIFHTDGNVNAVVDLYIEAGFDCLQPLESKAGMDVRRLCPSLGDRLAFFGNIDVMVMATNDPEKLEHEVETKLEAGMATRGYAYHSDHSVPPTVSWATYQHLVELLDRCGRYT